MEVNAGLVLEGGGMRGAYTTGVLDFFHDEGMDFPLVSTASAAALIGSSYIAKQRGRNYEVLVEVWKNPESISFKRMLLKKELFGMDFIFDKIPNELVPFDFDTFSETQTKFIIGTTDINSGKPVYYETYETKEELFKIIRASSTLPLLAPSITYRGKELMDGGISDPIPIAPSIENGYKKHLVILTRNRGYVKKATKLNWLFKRFFKHNPEFIRALKERHIKYNQTMNKLREMERKNEVFIIQPEDPLKVSRIERKKEKLHQLYLQGYKEAEEKKEILHQFLST